MAEDKKLEDIEAKFAEAQKSIEALAAKNKELLDEKRQTKSGAERQLLEAQDRISELEGQIHKVQGDAKKSADKYAAEIKAAQDIAAGKSATLSKLIKDEGLAKELLSVGVKNPAHNKAAAAMLRDLVMVDEENGVAYVPGKDPKTGAEVRKALAEFTKEWAASDEGKSFVTAPASSGGGAVGGHGTGSVPRTLTMAEHQALQPKDQAAFFNNGGTLIE